MSDTDALHEAFRGFEEQADRVSARRAVAGDDPVRRGGLQPSRRRALMVASAAAAVVAVAVGVSVLAPDDSHGTGVPAGGLPVGGVPAATSSAAITAAVPPATSRPPQPSPATPTAAASRPPQHRVPQNRPEMVAALTRVLGSTATFTVNEAHGNYLIGTLTAAGNTGGFDIQANDGKPGDEAICEDADTSHCVVGKTTGGGSLSTGHEPTQGGGELYLVNYVRPDGGSYLMHLSNLSDPKGAGKSFGSTPPLTIKQMVKILESDRW